MGTKNNHRSYAERNRLADTAISEPKWFSPAECIVIHDLLLVRYGGNPGVRDEAALREALTAPKEQFTAGCVSLAKLAAVYIAALIEKEPFESGNVAIAFLTGFTFLRLNGRKISGKEDVAAETTEAFATGKCPAGYYLRWLYANTCE